MRKVIEMTGLVYGDYVVKEYLGDEQWSLQCKCGTEVVVSGYNIRRGLARKKCIHYNKPPYLTEREKDICRLIVAGLSNREIAEKLGIGAYNVRAYIFHMRRKFNIYNRKELAIEGLKTVIV